VTLTAITVVMQVKTLRPGLLGGYKGFIFAYGTVVGGGSTRKSDFSHFAGSHWFPERLAYEGSSGLVTIRPTFFLIPYGRLPKCDHLMAH
jgi:hypothetical protein